MTILLVLPLLIPLLSAALAVLAPGSARTQRWIGVCGTGALLAAALALGRGVLEHGVLAVQMGGWPAPFGITLVADVLGCLMVVLTGVTGFAVAIYSLGDIDGERLGQGFTPLFLVLLLGVNAAFLTGDIFNLYVCFEVMLMASFVLMVLGSGRRQTEGALKYVTLNLVASAIFLAGVGVLYGMTGTLNMAHLAGIMPEVARHHPDLVAAVAGLFLVSFGIKAGLFPLYFWLPSSYHTPPVAVSAVFAGLLTKVGVYALLRVFTLVFAGIDSVYRLLLALAALTMIAGVLGAISQFHIRRILSFHIISQIGYMVMGLGLLVAPDPAVQRLALAGAVFYIAHHIIVKTNLFLIGGIMHRLRGTEQLGQMGGLYRQLPYLALLFLVPALSLAGVPPLSGFWAKLTMIRAGLAAGAWLVVAAALAAGVMTLMSMLKIWNEAFWKPQPDARTDGHPGEQPTEQNDEEAAWQPLPAAVSSDRRGLALTVAPSVGLALLTLLIGLFPGALLDLAGMAADQLLDPMSYLEAVGVSLAGGGP
jgi:multicomponent Na+:H+ antiporter subunit D